MHEYPSQNRATPKPDATPASLHPPPHSPHALTGTCTAVAVMRPSATAWSPVSSSSAACARLKPVAVWSMASTVMDLPAYVRVQQVPHWSVVGRGLAFGGWVVKKRGRGTHVDVVPPGNHIGAAHVGEVRDVVQRAEAVLGLEAVGAVGARDVVEREGCVVVDGVVGDWAGGRWLVECLGSRAWGGG